MASFFFFLLNRSINDAICVGSDSTIFFIAPPHSGAFANLDFETALSENSRHSWSFWAPTTCFFPGTGDVSEGPTRLSCSLPNERRPGTIEQRYPRHLLESPAQQNLLAGHISGFGEPVYEYPVVSLVFFEHFDRIDIHGHDPGDFFLGTQSMYRDAGRNSEPRVCCP